MKSFLIPSICLLGGAISTPVPLEGRQFQSSFPAAQQAQTQGLQKASGVLITRAWGEVGQTYTTLTTALKCVSNASPLNPPPGLLLNCGVGEAHKAIANKLWETAGRFDPNTPINFAEAGAMVAPSATLTNTQVKAFKALESNWAVSVKTRERQLVYESLVQQLSLYNTWAKAYNQLMPTGTKTAGDQASANIVKQYQSLIKMYQWDVPS